VNGKEIWFSDMSLIKEEAEMVFQLFSDIPRFDRCIYFPLTSSSLDDGKIYHVER
jgi:hypothetical protein